MCARAGLLEESAQPVYTNANLFQIKRKIENGKYTTKLTFLWYDNFGEKAEGCHSKNAIKNYFDLKTMPWTILVEGHQAEIGRPKKQVRILSVL